MAQEQAGGLDQSLAAALANLRVPDSPAFAVLGVAPENTISPKSPRELGLGLLNGTNGNGDLTAGLAIDTAPYFLLGLDDVSALEYNTDVWRRYLASTEVSIATAAVGDGDDGQVALATSLRWVPWNRGDPFKADIKVGADGEIDDTAILRKNPLERTVVECFHTDLEAPVFPPPLTRLIGQASRRHPDFEVTGLTEALKALDPRLAPIYSDAEGETDGTKLANQLKELLGHGVSDAAYESILADYNTFVDKFVLEVTAENQQADDCRERFEKASWNASSLAFGVAPTWTSTSGSFDDLEWSGAAIYGSIAYGFEESTLLRDRAQLIGHVRYRADEIVSDNDVAEDPFEQDTLILAGQLRSGFYLFEDDQNQPPDMRLFGEVGFIDADRKGASNDDFFRYSIGSEFRLSNDLYLNFAVGSEVDSDAENSFILGSLRVGFSETSGISIGP